ncbi:MAG: hypothetical protein Q4C33_04045 [bacterium]|nr:hypothetical protein [bacterium]
MKINEFKCKNCGATINIPENARQVKCSYCNTSFDVEDAYSEAYKYHKGVMDAATEGFEKQYKIFNDVVSKDPMFKFSRIIFFVIFTIAILMFGFVIYNIVTNFNM